MKKLLLAGVLAIASFPGYVHAGDVSISSPGGECTTSDQSGCDNPAGWKIQCAKGDQAACEALQPSSSRCHAPEDGCDNEGKPPARVTVAPPYQGPPPIGWVYAPYTQCGNPPQCSMGVVSVGADGLNVRVTPNGPAIMSLVNGVPLIPVDKQGNWILVAAGCDLTPTWAWSWTAGVPLNRCWVYF